MTHRSEFTSRVEAHKAIPSQFVTVLGRFICATHSHLFRSLSESALRFISFSVALKLFLWLAIKVSPSFFFFFFFFLNIFRDGSCASSTASSPPSSVRNAQPHMESVDIQGPSQPFVSAAQHSAAVHDHSPLRMRYLTLEEFNQVPK